MSKRPVCRACLVDNLTMYRVTESPYEEAYEKLSNAKLGKGNLPETFCYMCVAMLRKFQKFAALTQESNVMLEQWYKNEIDCKPKNRLQFKISTTTVEYITSKFPDPELAKDVKIKIEPDEPETINQVQFIEFTNETDPYVPEETTDVNIETADVNMDTTDVNMEDSLVKDDDSWPDADQKPEAASDDDFEPPVVKQEPKKRAVSEKTPKGTPDIKKPNTLEVITRQKKGGFSEKTKFACDYCDKNDYSYADSLKQHLQKFHSDKKPIICDFCDHEALNKSLLESHVTRLHKEGKEFVCYICEYASSSKTEFIEHLKIHTGTKAFTCSLCETKFTRKNALKTHLDTVHKEELSKSDGTNITAAVVDKDVDDLIERIYPDKLSFSCDRCDFKCGFKFELEYHLFIHDEKWPFACTMCGFRTSLKERVRVHLRIHSDEKQYMCKLCGFKSLTKCSLKLHVRRTHFGEKPFSCDECDSKFAAKRTLKCHYLSRHCIKEKPFLCHMCDKTFRFQGGLATHLKNHTIKKEKKFTCSTCGFKAQIKGNLIDHIRTHTGEKPYACRLCDRRFAQKSALNRHVKLHK